MKKTILLLLILSTLLSLASCGEEPSPKEMLSELSSVLSLEGVIYSPDVPEGGDGYITEELFSDIFLYYGEPPKSYAIMLNSRTDTPTECAVFVCSGTVELHAVIDACNERMKLLTAKERGLLIVSGSIVFYSTLEDRDRVRVEWTKILRAHT